MADKLNMAAEVEDETVFCEGVEHSPCIYRKNLDMVLTNKKKYCGRVEIYRLMEKGYIASADIELMRTLFEHGYLTRKTLTDIITYNSDILPENKRKYYKNSLKKLTLMGVLHRYSPTWEEDGVRHNGPCIYTLSAGSSGYISKLYRKNTDYFRETNRLMKNSPAKILSSSVCGQFHASMLQYRTDIIKKHYVNYSFTYQKEQFCIPLAYKLKGKHAASDMVVFCVRNNDGFEKYAVHMVQVMRRAKFKDSFVIANPIYVFICENSTHARVLAAKFRESGLIGLPILYCLDRTFLNGDVLENLFTVETTETGYQILLQKLDI